MTVMQTMTDSDMRERLAAFVALEARLADAHRYEEWLELWDEECPEYFIPIDEGHSPGERVPIVYDDRQRLSERVMRLSGGYAHSQIPRHQLARVVSNLEFAPSSEAPDDAPGEEYQVAGKFILAAWRHGVQDVYAGDVSYWIRAEADRCVLRKKQVVLINRHDALGNLTFIV